jgi:hypothetical protein
MKNKINKCICWAPRILAIIFILFLTMLSADIFGNNYTFWEVLLGLFMHNLPTLSLLIVLIISWKHELVGGIAFILFGFLYTVIILLIRGFQQPAFISILIIAGISLIIGILFIISWIKKKKGQRK